jgi:uncharacterized membrane protein YgaE (UPF0421/DUF939 family)
MKDETKELLKEIKAYRNDMVARNYPFQQISDIITKWEMKEVTTSEKLQDELEPITDEIDENDIKDFLDEAEREKKELEDSYKESVRQTEERRSKEWIKGYNKWKK